MSKAPFMIDCPRCTSNRDRLRETGFVERYMGKNEIVINDICERCGGSGRIAVSGMLNTKGEYKINRRFSKKHKVEMRKWLEIEKELIYGKSERIE